MRTAVIGAGLMGSVIAWDLSHSKDVDEISVVDIDSEKLSRLRRRVSDEKLATSRIDITNSAKLSRFLNGKDVAIVALPHGMMVTVDMTAIEAGVDTLDLAFEDNQMKLDRMAKGKGVTFVPGCGLAPGLSNILVMEAVRELDSADEAHIWVGGIPQKPEPPLGYKLVFSIKGLLNEYLTRPRVIRDGKVVELEPFSEVEEVNFEAVGKCEAFFTDGLAAMLYAGKGFKRLDERTVRWPGHAEKIKFMMDAGFFGEEAIKADGASVSPVDLSSALLYRLLTKGDAKDITLMRVEVTGKTDGRRAVVRYELEDYYDEGIGITSMGKTTGYTCAIISRMVGRGEIDKSGVVPPEVALDSSRTQKLLTELARKGVRVRRRRSPV